MRFYFLFLFIFVFWGCSDPTSSTPIQSEVKIGQNYWMTKNLSVAFFSNGDSITFAKDKSEWRRLNSEGKPAWCYYNDDAGNQAKYGLLYNWYALNDSRGLAPTGYRIANEEDWNNMIEILGGRAVAGKAIKSNNGWNDNGNGDNTTQFSANPAGKRDYNGEFMGVGNVAVFWIKSDNPSAIYFSSYTYSADKWGMMPTYGFSVRCIKN
jgi:uncharacterized protein (TIGR02145 family)